MPHIALMLPNVLLFKRYLVFITHKWLPFKLIFYCLFNEVSNQVALDKKWLLKLNIYVCCYLDNFCLKGELIGIGEKDDKICLFVNVYLNILIMAFHQFRIYSLIFFVLLLNNFKEPVWDLYPLLCNTSTPKWIHL